MRASRRPANAGDARRGDEPPSRQCSRSHQYAAASSQVCVRVEGRGVAGDPRVQPPRSLVGTSRSRRSPWLPASSTLDEAAGSLDIKGGSLRRTLRMLDAAIGEPLVVDLRRDAPLGLTPVRRCPAACGLFRHTIPRSALHICRGASPPGHRQAHDLRRADRHSKHRVAVAAEVSSRVRESDRSGVGRGSPPAR